MYALASNQTRSTLTQHRECHVNQSRTIHNIINHSNRNGSFFGGKEWQNEKKYKNNSKAFRKMIWIVKVASGWIKAIVAYKTRMIMTMTTTTTTKTMMMVMTKYETHVKLCMYGIECWVWMNAACIPWAIVCSLG